MPFSAPSDLEQALHETNSRMHFLLDRLLQNSSPGAKARPVTPRQMAELLSELMKAGQWLRILPEEKAPALEQELREYRKHVERLQDLLPSIHSALLRERDRLEQKRQRLSAARGWADRSRQTL